MPDQFGFATPQEIRQQQMLDFRQRQVIAQQGSDGDQLGNALFNIFGGSIKKTFDTRRARQTEALRLVKTQGISEEAAKEQAKENIGRDFKENRQAKRVQDANSEMTKFMEQLPDSMPRDMKQAQGALFMSNRLRSMGLVSQANSVAAQAGAAIQAAEDAALKRADLKAQTAGRIQSTSESVTRESFAGMTDFQKNVAANEQIIGKLNDPQSQLSLEERDSLLRQKGSLEAKILKDSTIVGRSASDVRSDPVLQRKLFTDIADQDVLLARINEAEDALADLDSFDATRLATWGVEAIAFAENWFGRTPSESEQDFVDRVVKARGGAAFIAAKIRHSLTGAQMSAFEIKFLTPFLPGPADSKSQMLAKLRTVKEYTQLSRDTRIALFQTGDTMLTLQQIHIKNKGAVPHVNTDLGNDTDETADLIEDTTDRLAKFVLGAEQVQTPEGP